MNKDMRELIADIEHSEHVSRQNVIDAIVSVEQKKTDIDYYAETQTKPERSHEYVRDHIFDSSLPKDKNYSDYDFKTNNSKQGRINRDVAKLILDIEGFSNRYHRKITRSTNQLIVGDTSRREANDMKYVKTKELIEMMNKANLPNFVKMTFVSDNIGRFKDRKFFVIFLELDLPDGEYMLSWHLEKTKRYVANNVCCWISECNYNNPALVKYGNKRKELYDNKELEYELYTKEKRAGDPAIDALCNAFDFK